MSPPEEAREVGACRVRIVRHAVVTSTSQMLRDLAERGERGPLAMIAEEQTGGVGQRGRAWASPRGGLWLSLVCPWHGRWPASVLGVRMGWAVLRAVEAAVGPFGLHLTLKWPNDVLLNGRKLAGVLTELVGPTDRRAIIVGVGINVNTPAEHYPPELRSTLATLRGSTGREVDLGVLGAAVVDELVGAVCDDPPPGLMEEISRRLHGVGTIRTVTLPGGERAAVQVVGLDPDGRLRVRRESRELVITSVEAAG